MSIKTMTVNASRVPLLATLLLAGGALFAGAAHAQTNDRADPGMLPDHPLYFMTSMSEGVGTFFTFGEINESERALKLSEKRLVEARALAADGKPEEAQKAVERYETQLDRALTKAEQAQANGDDADEVLTRVSDAIPRHQAVLAEVHQKVPEQARPGIERAMEASKRGNAQAKRARSGTRGRPDAAGRPESAGPPHSRGQGPPDDAPDADRPDADERPDRPARDPDRPDGPDADDRRDRGGRGLPDSVKRARPDTAGGR